LKAKGYGYVRWDLFMTRIVSQLPSWFRQEIPDASALREMKELTRSVHLHTVCEDAHCPNSGKCWQQGVVTTMILGNVCTRSCKFCAVKHGHPFPVDSAEPENVAALAERLNLRYMVVTSVTRDDLPDGGAEIFAATIRAIRAKCLQTKIEVLIPDFLGDRAALKKVAAAGPEVISHNLEMVRRLFPQLRPQGEYERSLKVLRTVKSLNPRGIVKSGFMVGLGEKESEVKELLQDLFVAGCDIVTVGQYLAPTKGHHPVARFVAPEEFADYKHWGEMLGLKQVTSGPLVRSSYLAEEGYQKFLKIRGEFDSCP